MMWTVNSIGSYAEVANMYSALHGEFDLAKKYIEYDLLRANDFPWLTDTFVKDINGYIDTFFYSKLLLEHITQGQKLTTDNFLDFWERLKQNTYFKIASERYHLNGLYRTMFFEYNPIENYNMVEEGTDVTSGTTSSTDKINKTESVNNEYDSSTTTDIGEQLNNTKSYKSPYDSQNLNIRDSEDAKLGERHDNNSNNGSSSSVANEDDTHTFSGNTDNTLTHKLTRAGNIGSTMTQTMIELERKTVSFNFLEIVCKLIVNSITRGYYT